MFISVVNSYEVRITYLFFPIDINLIEYRKKLVFI